MIKWLLTGLEDAYSSDLGVASKVWDYLDMEMPCTLRPAAAVWDDAPAPAAPAPALPPPDDDLLWRNCMWGGRCSSHDHGTFSSRCAPAAKPPPAAARPPRAVGAGESLLKPSVVLRAQQPSPPPSPPPEVPDSEKEMVFVSMTDVVCDVRWTACPAVQPPPPLSPRATVLQVHEDHSYHLTRHSHSLGLDNLGVQTPSDSGTDEDLLEDEILEELPDLDADDVDFFGPESVFKDIAESVAAELRPIKKSASDTESNRMSDSDEEEEEEEIDVVSVAVEKSRALPTNPSVRDRRQLQQTVADAVCRRPHRRRRHRRRRHHHHHHRRRQAEAEELDDDPPPRKLRRSRLRPRSASDADDWTEEGGDRHRRSLHNNMERQRRIDLSNLVRAVRNLVPSLGERERAPRIVVLREAAHYCRQLQVEATQLAAYKQELARHNAKLRDIHQAALHDLSVLKMRGRPGRNRPRRYRD